LAHDALTAAVKSWCFCFYGYSGVAAAAHVIWIVIVICHLYPSVSGASSA